MSEHKTCPRCGGDTTEEDLTYSGYVKCRREGTLDYGEYDPAGITGLLLPSAEADRTGFSSEAMRGTRFNPGDGTRADHP